MQILNIFHVLIAIAMVAFVLVQRGPGATAGAAFGSGASGTVFGSRGAGSFLSRATWVLAALFCLISLAMAVVVARGVATPEQDLGVIGAQPLPEPAAQTGIEMPQLDQLDQAADLPAADTAVEPGLESDLPLAPEGSAEPDEGATDDG